MLIPVAKRTEAWACSWLLIGIAGSNPTGGMDVSPSVCCLLTDRGLYNGVITRPEESVACLVCDHDASLMRKPWPTRDC